MSTDAVTTVEFLAVPVKGEPGTHHMTLTIDGRIIHEGYSITSLTPKQLVEIFRKDFPLALVKLIDRTVQ